jgi:cytochrome P450
MTQARELPPLYMRRSAFDPAPELREIRESAGVQKIVTAFRMPAYLVTRYDDIKEVLSDPGRFSNRRPPGFGGPGAVVSAGSRPTLE